MVTTGMNLTEVRALAARLQQVGEQLRHVVSSVDGRVAHSTWHGPDAERFKHEWWPGHRSMLLRAADSVQGLGRSAGNNADEQERASANSAPIGGPSSGALPGNLTAAGLLAAASGALSSLGIPGVSSMSPQALLKFLQDPAVALTVARSLERTRSVSADGSTSIGGVPASYDASAEVSARLYATAGMTLDSSGLAAAATAGAIIAARADVHGSLGNRTLGADGHAFVEAEVGMKGSAAAKIGRDGASGSLHGDIGASVGVGADAHGHISGVEAGGSVHATAGLAAHADIHGSVTVHEIKTHVDVGAAIGIGGGVAFDVDVKPAQLFSDANHLRSKWMKDLRI
jgi:hypothetical protein